MDKSPFTNNINKKKELKIRRVVQMCQFMNFPTFTCQFGVQHGAIAHTYQIPRDWYFSLFQWIRASFTLTKIPSI